MLRAVIDTTGFEAYLRDFGGSEATERLENVAELEAAILAYERNASEPTVGGFLEETALVTDVDQYDRTAEHVTLMTLHAAKGLEFPFVCIVGMEEGVLPHPRSLESAADVEEERRLCYVGMTRAKERLFLTHARLRRHFGDEIVGAIDDCDSARREDAVIERRVRGDVQFDDAVGAERMSSSMRSAPSTAQPRIPEIASTGPRRAADGVCDTPLCRPLRHADGGCGRRRGGRGHVCLDRWHGDPTCLCQ